MIAVSGRQQPGGTPVRLGLIGVGVRGTEIAKVVSSGGPARIVAAADLYAGRRERASELLGTGTVVTEDYRRVIARPDVDAVVIATPDHWHASMLLEALEAGKDVYCEAPVVHPADDGSRLASAAAGRVVQVGGALQSGAACLKAKALIASGVLGRVTVVRGTWDSVSALDAWQRPFPPDASPESIDFARFLGPAPPRPFDLHRFFRWPCFRDYGSGLAGARVVPLLTAVHALLGLERPLGGVLTGGTWRWRDGREVPDALVATFDYASGLTVTIAATQNGGGGRELQFVGTEATLVVSDARVRIVPAVDAEPYAALGESWPKNYRDWFYMMHGLTPEGTPRREFPARPGESYDIEGDGGALAAHLADFVACVRTRQEPAEPLRLGLAAARAVADARDESSQRARLAPR